MTIVVIPTVTFYQVVLVDRPPFLVIRIVWKPSIHICIRCLPHWCQCIINFYFGQSNLYFSKKYRLECTSSHNCVLFPSILAWA